MKEAIRAIIFTTILGITAFACQKSNSGNGGINPPPGGNILSYGDSIFYLKNQTSDYIISPVQSRVGHYIGFPEGIDLDPNNGQINISKSETGLRYRITFVPDGTTDSINTAIVISGINFLDGFYKLTTADSVLKPIYNANGNSSVPGVNTGSVFDIGSGCNTAGCNVNTALGSINLAQTVRNGVFGSTPSNNDRHEFQLNYKINDKSSETPNTIKVKLYYFDTINDVTQECYDIISSREGALFGIQPRLVPFMGFTTVNGISQANSSSKPVPKPRPPCIFILGR
jgi:hypothetical protein